MKNYRKERSGIRGENDYRRKNSADNKEKGLFDDSDGIRKKVICKEKNSFRWIIICIVLAVVLLGALFADCAFHKSFP